MTMNKSSKKISHNSQTVITKQNTLKADGLKTFFGSSILQNFMCAKHTVTQLQSSNTNFSRSLLIPYGYELILEILTN